MSHTTNGQWCGLSNWGRRTEGFPTTPMGDKKFHLVFVFGGLVIHDDTEKKVFEHYYNIEHKTSEEYQ
ncbi:hypothetical protein OUZ56_029573 [Daphnia magna]|uniref:Uncharacterized protein n=1 Tax=Daphnia magna TaxID=35525 RepID=A0ABR0B782_9CRUS|nr:hypothetical protein OUZ56_029573 [Daphnia magna]